MYQDLLTDSYASISEAGSEYNVWAMNGPVYIDISAGEGPYDFRAVVLQNRKVIEDFTGTMRGNIYDEFTLVFILLPFEWFVLCMIVNIILHLIIYLNVLKPIKELTKVAQDIKKENNIQDIRELLRNNKLFKEFKQKGYTKEVNVNDEITNLKKTFYDLFNDESNDHKLDPNDGTFQSNSTKVLTKYDYPINIYYNEDIKNELAKINKEREAFNMQTEGKQTSAILKTATVSAQSIESDDESESNLEIDKQKGRKSLNVFDIKPPIQIPTEQLLNQLRDFS